MRTIALGEACEIVSGATPKSGVADYWGGDIAWATPADLSALDGPYIGETPRTLTAAGLASCSARILSPGSVLLSSRAPIGHVAINTIPMATNQGFKSLVPRPNVLDTKYLFHWLRFRKDFLQSLGNGATFKELSKATVERVQVPAPPLHDQRRIAKILDKADQLTCLRHTALQHLDHLQASIFHDLFQRTRGHWPVRSLGELADTWSGGTPDRSVASNFGGGIPWVKSGELNVPIIRETQETLTETGLSSSSAKVSPAGTVLVAMYGATAGAVSTLGIPAVTNQAICSMRPGDDTRVDYLVAALRSMNATLLAKRAGGAQPNLSQTLLRALPIVVPPLETQQRFANHVRQLDRLRSRMAEALDVAGVNSFAQRAFSGQL